MTYSDCYSCKVFGVGPMDYDLIIEAQLVDEWTGKVDLNFKLRVFPLKLYHRFNFLNYHMSELCSDSFIKKEKYLDE